MLSWLARVEWQERARPRGSFEVLVRHLFARLLHSTTLDVDDAASAGRTAQLAYAAALPTVLFALYLFPAYHNPLGKPGFWEQASHHFFYVDASFAVMGLAAVLLWDGLFPDPLDALILTHLPVAASRMLAARVLALVVFLGGILLGTCLLGILFFPAVADLPVPFLRHILAHAAAVFASGLCAVFAVLAPRGAVVCCFSQRWAQRLSTMLQAACVLLFTVLLVVEPLLGHLLPSLLASPAWRWFPPFWFLGLYEHLLLGAGAQAAFAGFARSGLLALAALAVATAAFYPAAYARRTRQLIEGAPSRTGALSRLAGQLLRPVLPGDGRSRAVVCWIGQTLPRLPRTRLLLAFFAALVLAAPFSVLLLKLAPATPADAALALRIARLAPPLAALLTVAGLRAAFRLPAAERGAWAFRGVHGRAQAAHRRGAEVWAACCGAAAAVLTTLLTLLALPQSARAAWSVRGQAFTGALLALLYADSLFLRERPIPFTERRAATVNDLSFAVVAFFAVLPGLAFASAAAEAWLEGSRLRTLCVSAGAALAHCGLRRLRARMSKGEAGLPDMEEELLLPGEIGLRS